jgi:GPH family glycoside/pentoside/hexuronide:cation symporter
MFLPETSWIITIAFCIASVFGMVSGSMSTALFSDTVIYGEWKSGRNIRAFIMSVFNVPIKIGVFIRSGVISIGLVAIGYVANTPPTPEVVNGIRSIMMFAPAASCILAAAIFYFGYKIEDRQVLQMQEEIDQRHPTTISNQDEG